MVKKQIPENARTTQLVRNDIRGQGSVSVCFSSRINSLFVLDVLQLF